MRTITGQSSADRRAGAEAHQDGLPYDPAAHPNWQASWQIEAGRQAHQFGLPYDPATHPAWQHGWMEAEEQ